MMFLIALVAAAMAGPNPGILSLEHVEQFTLQTPEEYVWNADRPSFHQGTLFVVTVDKDKADVHQAGGTVLYVGRTPAARLNPGHLDGRIIAYVPGQVDLSKTPIFWGPSTLPERIRPDIDGRRALENAQAKPFKIAVVQQAHSKDQGLTNAKHLQVRAAELIDRYAPQDRDFARGYRAGWTP